MTHQELTTKLLEEIRQTIEEKSFESLPGDFDALAEEVVSALISGRDNDLALAYEAVERAYSATVVKFGLVDAAPDERMVTGQLEAFTRVLAVALHHRRPSEQAELIARKGHRELLLQLRDAEQGLSGRDLARALAWSPENVARELPTLRAAGLVDSVRVGKSIINTVTGDALEILARQPSADRSWVRRTQSERLKSEGKVLYLVRPATQPAEEAIEALRMLGKSDDKWLQARSA